MGDATKATGWEYASFNLLKNEAAAKTNWSYHNSVLAEKRLRLTTYLFTQNDKTGKK
jgi:hypothetical protein